LEAFIPKVWLEVLPLLAGAIFFDFHFLYHRNSLAALAFRVQRLSVFRVLHLFCAVTAHGIPLWTAWPPTASGKICGLNADLLALLYLLFLSVPKHLLHHIIIPF
jgi:hypothetical protein